MVVHTVYIYHRVSLQKATATGDKSSDFRAFEVGQEQKRERLGPYFYDVTVWQELLFPLKAGETKLPPYRLRVSLLQEKQQRDDHFDDLFSDFFMSSRHRVVEETIATKTEVINVRPLPDMGKPENFTGLVGTFDVDADLSKTSLQAGETSTLTLKLHGLGLLDSLGKVQLNLDPKIKVYNDKPETSEKIVSEGLRSQTVYKYALVPSTEGEMDLKSFKLSYFDPDKEEYQTVSKQLGHLKVSPSTDKHVVVGDNINNGGSQQQDVKTLTHDLIDIHRQTQFSSANLSFNNLNLLFLLLLSSFASYLLTLAAQFLRSRNDPLKQRRSSARKIFSSKIQDLAATTNEQRLNKVFQLYKEFLGNKLGINGLALTSQDVSQILTKKKLTPPLVKTTCTLMKSIEGTVFGGIPLSTEQNNALLDKIQRSVKEIDTQC